MPSAIMNAAPVVFRLAALVNLFIYIFVVAPKPDRAGSGLMGLAILIAYAFASFCLLVAAETVRMILRFGEDQTRILDKLTTLEKRMGGSQKAGEDSQPLT